MKSFIFISLLCSGLFQFGECKNFKFGKVLMSLIGKFDSIVDTGNNIETVWNLTAKGDTKESQAILQDLGIVKDELYRMNKYRSVQLGSIENILNKLRKGPEIRKMKRKLSVHIRTINNIYKTFSIYLHKPNDVDGEILNNFLSMNFDKVNNFIEIQKKIAPTLDVDVGEVISLPVLLARNMKNAVKRLCGTGATAQQYLFNLFLWILRAEVKATVLLTFMGALKFRHTRGWETYKSNLENQSRRRYNAYVQQFSQGLHVAPREYRSCDPEEWIEGTSYWELNGFNQVTIFRAPQDWLFPYDRSCEERATALNRAPPEGTCPDSNLVDCYDKPQETCFGTLTTCLTTVVPERCILNKTERRYGWIRKPFTDEFWGRVQDGCDGEIRKQESWGACICDCIGAINEISLVLSMSQIHKQRVITAMRFNKFKSIIYLQVKEGTLGPNGTIIENFDEWKPLYPTENPGNLMRFNDTENAFNTDVLKSHRNEVLIGVGFIRSEENDKRLKLQIQVIKVEWHTGAILGQRRNISSSSISNHSLVIGVKNSAAVRKLMHVEDSLPGHHVRFHGSFLPEDAGQTTLPLFDATPVEGSPVSPLSGVGLIHKGVPGYAGFLALKAIGLDLCHYFDEYYLQ